MLSLCQNSWCAVLVLLLFFSKLKSCNQDSKESNKGTDLVHCYYVRKLKGLR